LKLANGASAKSIHTAVLLCPAMTAVICCFVVVCKPAEETDQQIRGWVVDTVGSAYLPIVPHCSGKPDSALPQSASLHPPRIFRENAAAQPETTMRTIVVVLQ
jgi:hypothetical protein